MADVDQDEQWYGEDDEPGFDERARDLLTFYPERFVSHCRVWTPQRNEIESVASHETLVGELLAVLVSVTEPATDEQREAMQRLRDVLYGERVQGAIGTEVAGKSALWEAAEAESGGLDWLARELSDAGDAEPDGGDHGEA